MSSNITLSAATRQNLLSLQSTADLLSTTQSRLSTGKKVNSAIDDPVNFFTAAGLNNRSSQLSSLLDGMSNGVQTINAANKGITSMTSLVQQLQSTVKQAKQDSTTATGGTPVSYIGEAAVTSTAVNNKLTFQLDGSTVDVGIFKSKPAQASSLAAAGSFAAITDDPDTGTDGDIEILSASLTGAPAGKVTVSLEADSAGSAADAAATINAALDAASSTGGGNIRASVDTSGKLQILDNSGNRVSIKDATGNAKGTAAALGFTGADATNPVVGTLGQTGSAVKMTTDEIAAAVNSNSLLSSKVKASVTTDAAGVKTLSFQNLSSADVTVKGLGASTINGDAAVSTVLTKGTNAVLSSTRQTLANQFNDLRSQLDKVAKDASFNGTNLLQGDRLKITFNERTGQEKNEINVSLKNASGGDFGIVSSDNLGIGAATSQGVVGTDFASNDALDDMSDSLTSALTTLQNQSSQLGANLSVVQTRQDFTKGIINILEVGASNLTDADLNEEAANSQALSTRQSIATSALSLANQAQQGILQLLR